MTIPLINNRTPHCLALALFVILSFVSSGQAQSALDGFDPNANGPVSVVVVQPDGKILIGGAFTALAPNGGASVSRNNIARLNPDGTLDTAFNPNANTFVYAIALQTDGKILVGGFFHTIGGQMRTRIARLDPITGLADSFDPSANDTVNAIAVQPDGKILVVGEFSGKNSIGGKSRNRIARLDPVTGLADEFDPDADATINAVTLQSDGKILLGGAFHTIGGQARNRIARIDRTTGLADSFNPNASGNVVSIAVQADGKILAAGAFQGANSIGGRTRNLIARLDPTTGLADSFNSGLIGPAVDAVAIQPDGKILIGGFFNIPAYPGCNNIARLDPVTGLPDSFQPIANGNVLSIAVQSDGKILVGGYFTGANSIGGQARNHVARLEIDGKVDQTLNLNAGAEDVIAIAVQADGKIIIGGAFNNVLGVPRNNIARLNTDGTLDTAFNPNANNTVDSIAVQPDGKILVGGGFTKIDGQMRYCMARLDATSGLADSFNPNADYLVLSITVEPNGKILVGGWFTSIGGQARNCMARLDAVTGLADSFNPNSNSFVTSIVSQGNGKIIVGGSFSSIGGQWRNSMARLDAATGLADSFNPNPDDQVIIVAVQPSGRVSTSGSFTSIGGQLRNRFARVESTTGLADDFNPSPNNLVNSIAVQADGKILASGLFNGTNGIGGHARNRIARLDGTTGSADSFDPSANDWVYSLALLADGKVLAGGRFTNIGGQVRTFSRLSNDTAALQNLAVTESSVTWIRGGSSPQLTRVSFEQSNDSVNYTVLGGATLVGNNWTLADLALPVGQNFYIRARGYYRSGYQNGSESITESVRNVFLAGPTPTPAPCPQCARVR